MTKPQVCISPDTRVVVYIGTDALVTIPKHTQTMMRANYVCHRGNDTIVTLKDRWNAGPTRNTKYHKDEFLRVHIDECNKLHRKLQPEVVAAYLVAVYTSDEQTQKTTAKHQIDFDTLKGIYALRFAPIHNAIQTTIQKISREALANHKIT